MHTLLQFHDKYSGMKCINSPSPLLSVYKHKVWPVNKPRTLQQNGNYFSLRPLTNCMALPSPIFLATIAPPAGKLSVLLKIGGACLFLYWVANFVVPEIVLKDLQSKEKDENSSEDEE